MVHNKDIFTIYNASAGSGKTYTLVKEYLKILFRSTNLLQFRNILALTFTNKAVSEMKDRIIETLIQFSNKDILSNANSMFIQISEELEINQQTLHEKSKLILNTVIHNYAAFDISTIDKFNHRLIRTFAIDLKIPLNFEVELDSTYILSKTVDKLIDSAGSNTELTKVLVDFAIEKADDDRSWDISYDFNKIAKLLINENEIEYLESIKNKSLQDFKSLKKILDQNLKVTEAAIKTNAQQVLTLLDEAGLQHSDFSRNTLPNHFIKLTKLEFNKIYDNNLETNLDESKNIYTANTPQEISSIIDNILPIIRNAFNEIKPLVYEFLFIKNWIKNLTPLSVLNALYNTLQELKEEDNFLLISEFNTKINNEIKDQPTPFIYERLGEKFKHFFIDEFQDTSILQWENLIPLIDNSLSGESMRGDKGSSMLVGDAKQAIYRWRGGKAEQFINLYNKTETPFVVEQKVKSLPVNYRSCKAIVNFNNAFFKHISEFVFTNPSHQDIYKNSRQDKYLKNEGYVELQFLNVKDEDTISLHCEKTLEIIQRAVQNGYSLGDICIITRKKKEGIAIAEYLNLNNIAVVSSESLLLKNSPEIDFIIHVISLVSQPNNTENIIKVLSYLAEYELNLTHDKHDFYSKLIHLDLNEFFMVLNTYGFVFNLEEFTKLPIYEAIESIIRQFKLNKKSNAYLQFFLDVVLDFSQKHNHSLLNFISFWERKKDTLSVILPEVENAIQIITIHKSKGLEFPVVIFPFANQDLYFDINPKLWYPINKENFTGFMYAYVNVNKDIEGYTEKGNLLYNTYKSELELDAINLLYVVLTRAIEQLYIISENDIDSKSFEKRKQYSGLFINYLKKINIWNSNQYTYSFGNHQKTYNISKVSKPTLHQSHLISTQKEIHNLKIVTKSGFLWDTAQEKAIEKGNIIHQIMSHIKTSDDIEYVLEHSLINGIINSDQEKEIKIIIYSIINHPALSHYFVSNLTIYNEKDIITKEGHILRPDRIVVLPKNEIVIIDYKTGLEDIKHKQQLFTYQNALVEMDFKVIKKILIYINDSIEVKEF